MKTPQARELLDKYQRGQCTDAEKAIIETWYLQYQSENKTHLSESEIAEDIQKTWDTLQKNTSPQDEGNYRLRLYRVAAVAAFLVAALSLFLYFQQQNDSLKAVNDIPAGDNRAVLTLSNGKTINLGSAENGLLAEESGSRVKKTANGVIEIQDRNKELTEEGLITIATPRGGKYEIILPDRTHVWMNAQTTLRFPAKFSRGKARNIELNGEAYFDVHHNPARPFKVHTSRQVVEDIGTQFNIASYHDEEDTRTTLVEGEASVLSKANAALKKLTPGMQASIDQVGNISIQHVDTEEAIAWKNGDFSFRNVDFKTAMRKISRWYNVEIVYDSSAPTDIPLGGMVSRSKNISVLLNLMEETGAVHFKIEGRKVIVSK